MKGFGKSQQTKKQKLIASNSQLKEKINLAVHEYQQGNLAEAKKFLKGALKTNAADSFSLGFLATIEKALGNNERALKLFERSTKIDQSNPDILNNYSELLAERNIIQAIEISNGAVALSPHDSRYLERNGFLKWQAGDLDNALEATIRALEINQDRIYSLMNLCGIHKDLGNLDQSLACALKCLELNPDNHDTLRNLGTIYKDLGDLDQALAYTLKSLELEPKSSMTLCLLGSIHMAYGETEEARKNLLNSIKIDPQEYGAYYELSTMLETTEEASELIKAINSAKAAEVKPRYRYFIEFAISNCLHKAENYGKASKYLQLANKNKLTILSSDAEALQKEITDNLAQFKPLERTPVNPKSGKERIFMVGMPRSGSTLLETILSMNPEIKDLGESRSLKKAIAKFKMQKQHSHNYQELNEIYSQMEPINNVRHKHSTDKQLYNFIYINFIASHMPAAKIIHCRRNPMDNVLSMYRSNLMAGNNYTANLEDAAKVLVAQELAMQIQKERYPEKIFTFDYDHFVNAPEANLRKLLEWLNLEFNESYLHPEKSTRSVNTASVIQARKPISNKSVGGWKNYENLLQPALKILQESGIQVE